MIAPDAKTFPPEHYDTAKHFGISGFSDAWGLTGVELSLTVEALGRQDVRPTLTENDLVGYYFLQYGGDNEVTAETLELLREDNDYLAGYAQPLKDILPTLLGDKTSQPIEIGRIALSSSRMREIPIDRSLLEVTDRVEVRGGAETGEYEGAKRFGDFLYPKDGVLLQYLGRSSVDLMQENPHGWLKRNGPHKTVIDQLAFHVDSFSATSFNNPNASTRERTDIYQALSYDESHHSELVKIALVKSGARND